MTSLLDNSAGHGKNVYDLQTDAFRVGGAQSPKETGVAFDSIIQRQIDTYLKPPAEGAPTNSSAGYSTPSQGSDTLSGTSPSSDNTALQRGGDEYPDYKTPDDNSDVNETMNGRKPSGENTSGTEAMNPDKHTDGDGHDHSHEGVSGKGDTTSVLPTDKLAKMEPEELLEHLDQADKLFLDRDKVGDGKSDKSQPVKEALADLLKNDPEFKENFLKAVENGVRVTTRYNADSAEVDIINNNVLQIDIPAYSDIAAALGTATGGSTKDSIFSDQKSFIQGSLKSAFSDGDIKPKTPEAGMSLEEVLGKSKDMKGADFVKEMERLGTFSFTGPNGDNMRKDVIHMYDNSEFMKRTMTETLKQDPERKFNWSSIGEGGGTISTPFEDFATSVAAGDLYKDGHDPAKDSFTTGLMAHEMIHSFLGLGDKPMMDIAGAVFGNEIETKDHRFYGTGSGKIAYDDQVKGKHVELKDGFNYDAFFEKIFKDPEGSNKYSFEQAKKEFGGMDAVDKKD